MFTSLSVYIPHWYGDNYDCRVFTGAKVRERGERCWEEGQVCRAGRMSAYDCVTVIRRTDHDKQLNTGPGVALAAVALP